MKLIKAKKLGFEEPGTVFSEVSSFSKNRINELGDKCFDDIELCGFSIMCGGDRNGFFHACLHIPDYVTLDHGKPVRISDDDWNSTCDTSTADFDEDDWVIVWDKDEVQHIIDNLKWAINGMK